MQQDGITLVNNNIQPIFSAGISIFKLENIDNALIIDYAKQTSRKNKFKENKDILTNNIFEKLNYIVKDKMNEYFSTIYNSKYDIVLSSAWSNIGGDKLITIPHIHNESFISAVYYPYSIEGEIIFLNPMTTLISKQMGDMIDTHNEYTSEYYSFPARTGHLIVFNSMLQHMVRCSSNERVSIAYNGDPIWK